ncbi:MAG: hypothetical protein A2Y62_12120 [Candidatus Fischerbacteria bacterium RBG_13_37_8]|uniref:Glycosyltransferase subfamily 4-like N-terminal domain-containing protein n=1 Tax=Candidatus Fischerbacteria bacterium RBG_13_37_8 TaxID=1817863 RepID=A0A1F5VDF2_9BACT|nr:MAG: hypothetical protein A2Y62_12120 [Candidatus Fischerbacteria bacterium RBG_13_37_8]
MIAPEPFFQERGTPFSEFYRIKALLDMGHEVDLATYCIGEDIIMKGLSIHRTAKIPGISNVKVGPSFSKLPLDALLFLKSLRMMFKKNYDLIHTHEEGGLIGAILKSMFKKPHLYDMHSSLSEQFINFNVSRNRAVVGIIRFFEKFILKRSDSVIVICDRLKDVALALNKRARVTVIENTVNPEFYDYFPKHSEEKIDLSFRQGKKLALYIGTFEHYQGMDILVNAAKYVKERGAREIVFACIGGNTQQQKLLMQMVGEGGVSDMFYIAGRVSYIEAAKLIDEADILLSPRKEGVNTPLKIYSYLFAGKPIVATNLLTHTQILNNEVAYLCDANGECFGMTILEVLRDEEQAKRIGTSARTYFEREYAYVLYRKRVKRAVDVALSKEEKDG